MSKKNISRTKILIILISRINFPFISFIILAIQVLIFYVIIRLFMKEKIMQYTNRSNDLCCLFDIIFSTFKGAVKYSKAVFAYSKCLFNAISNGAQFPIQLFHEGISSAFGCFKYWDCMFCTRIG